MQTIIRTGVSLLYQVIPDELQNDLIQIGENLSRDKWKIGDIANEIKQLTRERLLNCSIMDVYSFVAQLLRDEFSARTIEYYAGLSGFYDCNTREEFHPLSHSHFAYARQYGDKWLEVLNLAMDLLGQSGKVPSVAQVDYIFNRRGETLQDLPLPEMPPVQDIYQAQDEQTIETDYINSVISVPFQAAVTALEALQRLLEKFGKVEQAGRLGDMVRELRGSIDGLL